MNVEKKYIHDEKHTKARKSNKYCELGGQSGNKRPVDNEDIPARILPYLLDICPLGDGKIYENLTFHATKAIFDGITDKYLACQQFSSEGGRGDIELPFCTEMLPEYPCWNAWSYQYEIKSILVEVKNTANEATPDDVGQIKRYLDTAKRGRFGILVSRNGFSDGAKKTLRSYTTDNYLILPLDHNDLKQLLKLSLESSLKVARYLRRKETLLLRIICY